MALRAEPVSRRDRPAKPPLSRQSILDAAKRLIRERGVDAVALRHVAEAVETGPASLYAYFGSREVLLEHVLDAAYAEVQLVGADDRDWRQALAETIVNTIETLEVYPGLGAVALGAIPTLPGALRLAEHELAVMETGGVDAQAAALAVDLIAQFAAATAIERTARRDSDQGDSERGRVRVAYEEADPVLFPHIGRSSAALTDPDERSRRDFAIRVIITGIEQTATA
ncbi:TetR/AcrR family transcriptional regulator [Humibacter antri]